MDSNLLLFRNKGSGVFFRVLDVATFLMKVRKPSIHVLDEATSTLDTENEANIQEALERIQGKITIIVIAHRLSTIRNVDQVIVLDQGNIIQK